MKFEETRLKGLWQIRQEPRCDARGEFSRLFCEKEFGEQGLVTRYVQENRSRCKQAGTLRGLHLQLQPHAEVKLVRCVHGRIYDVAVDMRTGSATFLQWFGTEMTEDCGSLLYVPPGFAHGYQALTDDAEASYYVSSFYAPESEHQVRFDDPRIGVKWPIDKPILSEKDAATLWLESDFQGFQI